MFEQKLKTLKEIEADVTRLAKRISATSNQLPTYNISRDMGYRHIEIENQKYQYVGKERGLEIHRTSTNDYDELLYWVFKDATWSIASDYEQNNRIEDQDCRRIMFSRQIELMHKINPKMGKLCEHRIAEILSTHPYDDEPTRVVNRMNRPKNDRPWWKFWSLT
ncbi:MAG: Imm63 family immunity protein [Burkholderiaceae bacterium]